MDTNYIIHCYIASLFGSISFQYGQGDADDSLFYAFRGRPLSRQ
jgi:hypothetical protein